MAQFDHMTHGGRLCVRYAHQNWEGHHWGLVGDVPYWSYPWAKPPAGLDPTGIPSRDGSYWGSAPSCMKTLPYQDDGEKQF